MQLIFEKNLQKIILLASLGLFVPLSTEMSPPPQSITHQDQELLPSIEYLATLKTIARHHHCSHANIDALYEIVNNDSFLLTTLLVESGFEEIDLCLAACKHELSDEEVATLIKSRDLHHAILLEYAQTTLLSTRKQITNLVVHQALTAGSVFVAGDTIINNNLTINHNQTLAGNLQVAGNTVIAGDAVIKGNTIITGSVILPNSNITGDSEINGTLTTSNLHVLHDALLEGVTILSGSVILPGTPFFGNMEVIGILTTENLQTNEAIITSSGLTISAGGAAITGPTHINTTGPATTSIGFGGSGAVNIGNAIGNIFFPTNLASSQVGDAFLVVDPTSGQVRLDVCSDTPGAIINGGQPGPLTIGTTNATSLTFITSGTTNSRLSIASNGNITAPGFTTLGGLSVVGTATVNGLLYQLSETASPNNILYVHKGAITAPNQFNSINSALTFITTNSPANPFIIQIAPGIYTEPTLVMKPYVSIVGEALEACIIQTSSPAQDVIVGSANSSLHQVTLTGATNAGKAAIAYNAAGIMRVWDCAFGSNDILVNQTSAAAGSLITLVNIGILPTSNFTTGIKISPLVAGASVGVVVNNLLWGPISANITDFINITGSGAYFRGGNLSVGSITTRIGATFLNATDGALARLANVSLNGFDTAISLPLGVAPGPNITVWGAAGTNNSIDINIQNPFTTGAISGSFDIAHNKVIINPAVTGLALSAFGPATSGITLLGPLFTSTLIGTITNISPFLNQQPAIGVLSGGTLSGLTTNFTVTATAGNGYVMTGLAPGDNLQFTQWPTQSLILTQTNSDYFIFIDSNGTLQATLSDPAFMQTMSLGKARTSTTGVLFTQHTPQDARHLPTKLNATLENAFGPIYQTGSIVTQSGNLQLNVSSGRYFFGSTQYTPLGGDAITWQAFLGAGTNTFIGNQNSVDYQNYDGGNGSLVPIPLNQFARHELYVVNGPNEIYALVYSQTVFSSLNAAVSGVNPIPPVTWTENITPLASIIVTNTGMVSQALQQILDERPRVGFSASSVAGVSVHGNLLGLLADDHPQYLLVNGTRAMSGTLNMANNAIANANTITANGVLTAGGATITGATNVNISGAGATMLGNSSSSTIITGVTTINATGTTPTTIGNNIGPSTTTIHGATTLAATSGIPLSVTGNGSNPTISATGNNTTIAPALKLLNNPVGSTADFFLTIDNNGIVKQTSSSIANGVIINGGQTGPLSIGTTDATSLSLITNNSPCIVVNGTTGMVTIANGETISSGGLTVNAGGASVSDGIIATSGNITATAGNLNATIGSISAGTTITAGTGLTVTAGGANITGTTNINTAGAATTSIGTGGTGIVNLGNTTGNTAVTGSLAASTTLTAGTGITATTGNIVAASGNISASGTITGGTGVTATTGNVTASSGNVIASAAMSAGTSIAAGTTVTAGAGTVTLPAYSFTGNTNTGMYAPATNQLALVTSSTGRLIIDATGSVSYFTRYKAHAILSANQTVAAGATNTIVFNTETFDLNNNYNPATGVYTAPVSGYYWVSVCLNSTAGGVLNTANRTINLQKNGVTVSGYSATVSVANGTNFNLSPSTLIQLNQNDTLQVAYANGGNGTDTINANVTFLDVHFMSTV